MVVVSVNAVMFLNFIKYSGEDGFILFNVILVSTIEFLNDDSSLSNIIYLFENQRKFRDHQNEIFMIGTSPGISSAYRLCCEINTRRTVESTQEWAMASMVIENFYRLS